MVTRRVWDGGGKTDVDDVMLGLIDRYSQYCIGGQYGMTDVEFSQDVNQGR